MNDYDQLQSMTNVAQLMALLREKEIQIEAMTEFEQVYEEHINQRLNEKDLRIQELENSLKDGSSIETDRSNERLVNLLHSREAEVQFLENKVKDILNEKSKWEKKLRDSVSESMIDYENRVESLRRELIAKETQLQVMKLAPSIETSHTRCSVEKLDSVILSLDTRPKPPLSLVGQIVSISPRHTPAISPAPFSPNPPIVEDRLISQPQRLDEIEDSIEQVRIRYEDHLSRNSIALERFLEASSVLSANKFGRLCITQIDEFKRLVQNYRSELGRLRRLMIADSDKGNILAEIRMRMSELAIVEFEREEMETYKREIEFLRAEQQETPVNSPRKRLLKIEFIDTVIIPSSLLVDDQQTRADQDSNKLLIHQQRLSQMEEQHHQLKNELSQYKERYMDAESSIKAKEEIIAKIKDENLQLLRVNADINHQTVESETIRRQLEDMKNELSEKCGEIKKVKLRLVQTRREMAELVSARDHTTIAIPSPPSLPVESTEETLRKEIVKLRSDLVAARSRQVSSRSAKAKKICIHRTGVILSLPAASGTLITPAINPSELADLRSQFYAIQDENFTLRRKYEIDDRLQLDMAKLRIVSLENETIRLRSQVDDLEYQLGRLVRLDGASSLIIDEELLRLRVLAESREAEVDKVLTEKLDQGIDGLKDKNRVMALEFEKAVLEAKLERHVGRVVVPAVPPQNNGELNEKTLALEIENMNLRKQVMRGSQRPSPTTETTLRKEIEELRAQREQDKAAIKEAEKTLAMVRATEKKYVKVAKENARLKKDLESLDDDNFWNDLDVLQSQHKESLEILRNIRNDSQYISRRPDVARQIDMIIT